MNKTLVSAFWPVFVKAVLPSILTASGVMVAALYSEGFRAFCGFR